MDFIFDPSLVLYLPLYELNGSSFISRDAHGHSCTVTGALWTSQGRGFDGVDDDISNTSLASLGTLSALTIISWVKLPAQTAGDDYRTISTLTPRGTGMWDQFNRKDGTFLWYLKDAASDSLVHGVLFVDATQFGNWVMLSRVWDNANGYLYLNTTLKATKAVSKSGTVTFTGETLHIGSLDGGGQWWNSLIGEVLAYNRALTPLEIQQIYLATKWRYR